MQNSSPKARRSGLAIAARLIGLVKPMLPVMLLAVAMGVAGFLCAIFIAIFGGYALLNVLGFSTPFSLSFVAVAVLAFAFFRAVLHYAEQASNHYIAFKLLALIRDKVFRALRRLAPARLETRDKGNLISVITTDIELLEVFYAHTISPVAIAALVCVFMLVFLAFYHWGFALIALVGYVLVGLVLPVLVARLGGAAGMAYRRENGELGSTVLGSLRGLREVLQFAQGAAVLGQMRRQTQGLAATQKKMKEYEGLTAALANAVILAVSLAALAFGAVLYQKGVLAFSGVVVPFIAIIGSFGPVVALASLANSLLQTFAAADRVLDILDETPAVQEVENGEDLVFSGLAARNVSFAYGQQKVLSHCSLNISPRTVVGIQGKSGSGKSTLLRLIMRFWDVDEGEISLSGKDVRAINTKSLRSAQGLVTQDTVLFNDTIENNVKIANMAATRQQVEEACQKASIHTFIQSLPAGYATNVGELGGTLSGGERQRIGLARAFLHNAPLLLLDEPTSNLDSLNEGAILQALQQESRGKTVVLVSHRGSTLGIADRVVKVDNGRVSG
ncbi:MAG: amino acid ABC transporter ATP-binding/permease protein [Oscillospiraceae bacterium]